MRPMLEIGSRLIDITRTVLYASLVVHGLIRLGGEKVEFNASGLATSVALHIDTGHLIPMSNRPRSWRVERKTKGKGKKMPPTMAWIPARSISDPLSRGNRVDEIVHLIRPAMGVHGLPPLDGRDLSVFGQRSVGCSTLSS